MNDQQFDRLERLMLIQVGMLFVVLLLGIVGVCKGASPASELTAALKDCQAQPVEARPYLRYLTLYNVADKQRGPERSALSFALNSVSRSAVIIRPAVVSPTLLRINLLEVAPGADNLAQWTAAWEAIAGDDPYWHVRSVVTHSTAPRPRRSVGSDDDEPKPAPKKSKVYTDGGWLNPGDATALRAETQSGGAILRVDYFIQRATRPPHYYTLAGIPKNKNEWYSQLGIDAASIHLINANRGANLLRSGVTNQARRISRWPIPLGNGGAVWNTYDSDNSRVEADPIRNPAFDSRSQAGEHIATRRNGLHEYALFDAGGNRINEVDPKLAVDDTVHPGTALVAMVSCVRCHNLNEKEYALRSFEDFQSKLLANGANLYSNDPVLLESVRSFYGQQAALQKSLARDKEDYADAVAAATGGLHPVEATKAYADVVARYERTDIDALTALNELGLEAPIDGTSPQAMLTKLIPGATSDPILLALGMGYAVQRDQWEASFAEAALTLATKGDKP